MENINYETLVTAILGSGLLSGMISGLINYITNRKLKNHEYRLEHSKILLEKKIKGYEEVSAMVTEIVLGYRVFPAEYSVLDKPSNVKRFFIKKSDNDINNPVSEFYREIFETTMPNWFWYTDRFRESMKELFRTLDKITEEMYSVEDKESQKIDANNLILIGAKFNAELDKIGFKLLKIMRDDYPLFYITK